MTDGENTIAALIVDDQELVRSGLSLILHQRHGITVVGECGDGDEVPDAVARYRPDVVVMDLRMRRVGGIEATQLLVERGGPPVLALTTFSDDELLSGVLRAGASGFVLKDSPAEEIIRAIHAVGSGNSYLDPAVTERVLTTYRATASSPPASSALAGPHPPTAGSPGATGGLEDLTPREQDVLELLAKGRSNAEIAEELFISSMTVKTHIGRIFAKLGVRDRSAAIVYAFEHRSG
jgi:DNA-binding NarL/FixJ family response regulator